MLERWLASLPKNILATLAIVGGIFLILLLDPPHSKCDSQKEVFREAVQKNFFIEYKQRNILKKNQFTLAVDNCRHDPGPGSCFHFFDIIKDLDRQLTSVANQCVGKVANIKEIKNGLLGGMELIVKLAWGDEGPTTFTGRKGWLSEAEVAVYCQLQRQIKRSFGEERWKKFREAQFKKLPKAEDLSRNQLWSRSLFSVQCKFY